MTIRVQPLVHVIDMSASLAFYYALGARVMFANAERDFAMVDLAGCAIGLLAHPPDREQGTGRVELNFEADEPLEQVQARLDLAGADIAHRAADTAYGERLILRSPDGLLLKINRIDRDQS